MNYFREREKWIRTLIHSINISWAPLKYLTGSVPGIWIWLYTRKKWSRIRYIGSLVRETVKQASNTSSTKFWAQVLYGVWLGASCSEEAITKSRESGKERARESWVRGDAHAEPWRMWRDSLSFLLSRQVSSSSSAQQIFVGCMGKEIKSTQV